MAKVKVLKENELIGGTDNSSVYPITHTKAVFNSNNKELDQILNELEQQITSSSLSNFVLDLGLVASQEAGEQEAAKSEVAGNRNISFIRFQVQGVSILKTTLIMQWPDGINETAQIMCVDKAQWRRNVTGATGVKGAPTNAFQWERTAPHFIAYDKSRRMIQLKDYQQIVSREVELPLATSTQHGLMSAADKEALDNAAEKADTALRIMPFDGVFGNPTIEIQGVSSYDAIIFDDIRCMFLARKGIKYYMSFLGCEDYNASDTMKARTDRIFFRTDTKRTYIFNGTALSNLSISDEEVAKLANYPNTPLEIPLASEKSQGLMSAEDKTQLEKTKQVDDEPTIGSENLVKSGGVFTGITESDTGKDFLVKEVDNTNSYYIVYNYEIPKSKAVRFELTTKTAVLTEAGKNINVDLRLVLSDSSTLTIEDLYFNDKPYTYFSENLHITKIICGSHQIYCEQNGTVELKVSIGEYAEKMYFKEKVLEDINIEIPIYKIVNDHYINNEGIVVYLHNQYDKSIYVYDISKYVGKTLKITGCYPTYGVKYYLWSISKSDTFENVEDILAHSYKHAQNGNSDLDKYHNRDIVYVEPNYKYLAVAINKGLIQGKPYGCFELMNGQKSISYLQESTIHLQEYLDEVTAKVDTHDEKIQQIAKTVDAGFNTDIIYWGHSLVVGNQDGKGVNIENTVQSIIGGTFINAGIGGEETNDYAFRQGGATLVIPAGSINGSYNELYDTFDARLMSLGGQTDVGNTINPLVLSNGKTCNITGERGNWLISGYEGPATTYPLEARSKGSLYKGKILVLWPGANGTSFSQSADRPFSQFLEAQEMYVDSMIAHHGTDNYIIIGYTGTTTEADPASYWGTMTSINLKYGNKFINARQKLCEYGLAINGLTPNEHVAKIYKDGVQERTLLNVESVSEIASGTIHVEMTDGGESVISVDGNGVNIPSTTSYNLDGTTLTYTSSYRVSIENELTQLAGKHLPSRLVYDTVHLSNYGYFALGTIIAHRMIALGYDKLIGD